MTIAIFRFYGGLDFFLNHTSPPDNESNSHNVSNADGVHRSTAGQLVHQVSYLLDQESDGKVAVKHAVESLGVPHTEVDELRANGQRVGFDYALHGGDTIDVHAWTPKADHSYLRPPLPRPVRFVLDTHLGRLAMYLRLLGFDALYRNDYNDDVLAELSQQEGRVLLTRDRGVLKRRIVDFGCCIRESNPREQLLSLIRRYQLLAEVEPWQRCLRCNGNLVAVDKAEIVERLEPKTKRYYDDFRRCANCGQIYWRGSHYERMQGFIDQVLVEAQR
jgi:uncharacterized protein with PIN domain